MPYGHKPIEDVGHEPELALKSAGLCVVVMQALGNVDRLASLLVNNMRSQSRKIQQCLEALDSQLLSYTSCMLTINSEMSLPNAVHTGSRNGLHTFSFRSLNNTVNMTSSRSISNEYF